MAKFRARHGGLSVLNRDLGLRITLTREELERVADRRRVRMPLERQRPDDALTRQEDAIGQEHAEIRIAVFRPAAGIFHLDLKRETSGNHEEVRVHG